LRPVADEVLAVVSRYYASSPEPAAVPGMLWEPTGKGRAAGTRRGRPSLWALLRLGRGMLR
jgi:hypothetical protein